MINHLYRYKETSGIKSQDMYKVQIQIASTTDMQAHYQSKPWMLQSHVNNLSMDRSKNIIDYLKPQSNHLPLPNFLPSESIYQHLMTCTIIA